MNPQWYATQIMLGRVCYDDRYAGDAQAIRVKISYFKELGLTPLHLMLPFKVPEPLNDSGYAVSSYKEVNSKLGTMANLRILVQKLREAGISLVLDVVFNHTSDEHAWAIKARAGDPKYSDYYCIFPARNVPRLSNGPRARSSQTIIPAPSSSSPTAAPKPSSIQSVTTDSSRRAP